MSDYLVEQLSEVRADVAGLKGQRVTYRVATVVAVDPVASTFDAQIDGAGLLEGIPAERAFLPAVGDVVRLSLTGATPVYQPHRIGEGAVGEDELAVPVVEKLNTAIDTANGKNKQTFSASPAPTGGLGGEVTGDLWWQLDGAVLVAGWRWNGATYVSHTFGDGMFDTVNAAKIATGVLAAGVSITVGDPVGDRVVIDGAGGIARYVAGYDQPTVSIPGGSGGGAYFTVTAPTTGESLANIDGEGNLSGQTGTFERLVVGGQEVTAQAQAAEDRPRGLKEYGSRYTDTPGTTAELGIFEIAADLEVGRSYLIETSSLVISGPAGAVGRARIRFTSDGSTPSISSDVHATIAGTASADFDDGKPLRRVHTPGVSGLHRFLLTVARVGGTAGSVFLTGSQSFPIQMWVQDIGPYRGSNAVANDGGGSTAVTTVQTRTKRYYATWSGTYNGSALATFYGNEMKQGPYGGDFRGLVGFNSAQIMADLAGATIESCKAYLYANHWYFNSGGTAVIGTHSNTSRPSTWTGGIIPDRWRSSGWPKPGGRVIDLGTGIGGNFRSGSVTGLTLGPATSSLTFYGRFDGAGMAHPPYIEIRYTK